MLFRNFENNKHQPRSHVLSIFTHDKKVKDELNLRWCRVKSILLNGIKNYAATSSDYFVHIQIKSNNNMNDCSNSFFFIVAVDSIWFATSFSRFAWIRFRLILNVNSVSYQSVVHMRIRSIIVVNSTTCKREQSS